MGNNLINSQLICADYDKNYPLLDYGKGIFLYDKSGKEYIDASGATAVVTNIGHGVEEIADVLKSQAQKLSVHPTHLFDNEELNIYLKKLCDFAPAGFNKAWTISGGTEALENAIKLSFQYHRSKNQRRSKVLARWGSYHGNSILMLDIGGNKMRRDYYTDLMINHLHISPCFPYRKPDDLSLNQYEDILVKEFEETVHKYKNEIMCFVAEPIVGAALGAVTPTQNYFKRIKSICEQEDILLIADEVMTGMGRTGKSFGMEHFGVVPDIITMAKGISSGYFPLGALLAHDKVMQPIKESKKPFLSGQTYSCIPLASAVGSAVLDYHLKHNLIHNSHEVGEVLKDHLQELAKYETLGDVRGKGLFLSLEFVACKESKMPLKGEFNFSKVLEENAFKEGLIIYGCRGSYNLTQGDHILIAPPLILNKDQAKLIKDKLELALVKTESEYFQWLK